MQLFTHFPFLTDMVDEHSADGLERRFQRACDRAGVSPESPDALAMAIEVMADYATGLGAPHRPSKAENGNARHPECAMADRPVRGLESA